MLRNPEKYPYQLGILMPALESVRNLMTENRISFKEDNSNLKVVPVHREWALCPSSEDRLISSIKSEAAIVINGFMALKFEGKMCGLATENTITNSGHTFI